MFSRTSSNVSSSLALESYCFDRVMIISSVPGSPADRTTRTSCVSRAARAGTGDLKKRAAREKPDTVWCVVPPVPVDRFSEDTAVCN
jgi:hypothetical protein